MFLLLSRMNTTLLGVRFTSCKMASVEGIHGLSARHDSVHAQIPEGGSQPLPAHGQKAVPLLRRSVGRAPSMLSSSCSTWSRSSVL